MVLTLKNICTVGLCNCEYDRLSMWISRWNKKVQFTIYIQYTIYTIYNIYIVYTVYTIYKLEYTKKKVKL